MNAVEYYKDQLEQRVLNDSGSGSGLISLRKKAILDFTRWGIPTMKNEEWKYTRITPLLDKLPELPKNGDKQIPFTVQDFQKRQLPGHELANELVFVNGLFNSDLSKLISKEIQVLPIDKMQENGMQEILENHFDHSSKYLQDGIHALNTAFLKDGIFIRVGEDLKVKKPIYIYHITDARASNILSQPRSLVLLEKNAGLQIVETFLALGQPQNLSTESFSNHVIEIVLEKDASLEYYKIQNDELTNGQVSSCHIRQLGKSLVHTVVISLEGGMIRNNLNVVMESERCEAHLYGLYFQHGKTHIDNHTIVDNRKPGCFSNELYKGVLAGESTGVFNGKIFVRQEAQKTNAYQSNKNILLSGKASVNSKPQLEIFADDVKCSHGCTVGQLDDEAFFYLESRGIPKTKARALLVGAFASDIIEHIRISPIREWVEKLLAKRLEIENR
jgi:Fe-S cluster assembly protein SufD